MKMSKWIAEISRGDLVQSPAPILHIRRNRANFSEAIKRAEAGGGWLDHAAALIWAGRCVILAASAVADKPTRHEWAWRELFKMSRRLGLPMAAILTMASIDNSEERFFGGNKRLAEARRILEQYGKI